MTKREPLIYPTYFTNYFNLVKEDNLKDAFQNRINSLSEFYQAIPAHRWNVAYKEGKWTIIELVQHLLDAELVFLYRAMSIARGETQSMIGFDEDAYVQNTDKEKLDREHILKSLELLPQYAQVVFNSFTEADMAKVGICNQGEVNVAAIGYAIIGHDYHHRSKILELYL